MNADQKPSQEAPEQPSGLPVLSLGAALFYRVPCIVVRGGIRFIHDDERPDRTLRFFGLKD